MDVFIARQPIFDTKQEVVAYELLFRSGVDACEFDHPDPAVASAKVIGDAFLVVGFDTITRGAGAFVNATREILLRDYATLLPPERTTIEIVETVEADQEVLEACRRHRAAGYRLALDNFVPGDPRSPLLDLVDLVKVNFREVPSGGRAEAVRLCAPSGKRLVAERVETWEEFEWARSNGYSLFQGFFFSRPTTVASKDVPAFKLHLVETLKEVFRPELDYARIEDLIKRDMALTYKFLRFINSSAFGWQARIESIRHALALLGENEIRKWVTLVSVSSLSVDRPDEVLVLATLRAAFAESLAAQLGLRDRKQDFFLLGMFSLLDAVLDRPKALALMDLPLGADIREALLGGENFLRNVLDYVVAYERADWEELPARARALGLDEIGTPVLYLDAVRWSQETFGLIRAGR